MNNQIWVNELQLSNPNPEDPDLHKSMGYFQIKTKGGWILQILNPSNPEDPDLHKG